MFVADLIVNKIWCIWSVVSVILKSSAISILKKTQLRVNIDLKTEDFL